MTPIQTQRKSNPTRRNLLLDAAVFIAFLLALDPRLTGIALHEWLSLAAGAAIVVHLLWHWNWIVQVTRRFFGRTSGAARLNYVVNALFFVALALVMVSGVMVSQAILPFVGLSAPGGTFWLVLHSLAADAIVILVAVHVALHWKWIVNAVSRYVWRPVANVGRRAEVTQ